MGEKRSEEATVVILLLPLEGEEERVQSGSDSQMETAAAAEL